MADYGSPSSPIDKYKKPTSSFFGSPRLFTNFTSKLGPSENEAIVSPTSILDSKPFSGFKNPFWSETNTPKTLPDPETKRPNWDRLDSKGVGLGIVDALIEDKPANSSKSNLSNPESRMVLFGSQLKIQIPPHPPSVFSPSESLKSIPDSCTKRGSSQLAASMARKSTFGSINSGLETPNSPMFFTGCLSASEIELSEDYTRVICHGPNPRTTHIFENCIIEDCCFGVGFSDSPKENELIVPNNLSFPSENFLSFCHRCKKNLMQGKDIYIYRGEKAFCSKECRYQEMLLEEGVEKFEADDDDVLFGACS